MNVIKTTLLILANLVVVLLIAAAGFGVAYGYRAYTDYQILDNCAQEAGKYWCKFVPTPIGDPILPPPAEAGE